MGSSTHASIYAQVLTVMDGWATTTWARPDEVDFTPPTFTNNPASPAAWVDVDDVANPASEFLTYGGSSLVSEEVDMAILVEPLTGWLYTAKTYADSIIALFASGDATDIEFHTPRARVEPVGLWGEWGRVDLIIPIRRYA